MTDRIELNDVGAVSYPVSREAVAEQLSGITLVYADGESDFGELVAGAGSDSFDSPDDLSTELYGSLPT